MTAQKKRRRRSRRSAALDELRAFAALGSLVLRLLEMFGVRF